MSHYHDDPDPPSVRLANMAIGSVDTLRETQLDHSMPHTWNDQPPLLQAGRNGAPEDATLLKGMIRRGIPPALRCAVWLSNVIQAVHPHQNPDYWHEYRTLAKVRALDNAYEHLLQTIVPSQEGSENNTSISDNNDVWKDMNPPRYGQTIDAAVVSGITPNGQIAWNRVLIALNHVLGMDYAPLVPTLVALLLTHMSESYAFCAVREMTHAAAYYFPCTPTEHAAWCRAFGDVLRKLHPSTGEYLEDRGVLDKQGLQPIFQDFFLNVLPIPCVLRILDIYTLEGCKVLFRIGIALLVLYKMEASEQVLTISNADEWWHTLKLWAHSPHFQFDVVIRKAYGVHGRGMRRQLRFPRRSILTRIIKLEQERLLEDGDTDDEVQTAPPTQPLGLTQATLTSISEVVDTPQAIKSVLASSHQARLQLAEWMPVALRLTSLDLMYSTNYHGRTLERFYSCVRNAKHTVLLCEILTEPNKGNDKESSSVVIGMYASQPWHVSPRVYGDGECFLFRLQPDAQCWKWKPQPLESSSLLFDDESSSTMGTESNQTALLEQFMVGTNKYISMGGNPDGSCGLRLNEDFTRAETSTAVGFDNDPLYGDGSRVLEVGLVEVYRLVRQLDGKGVGGV